MFLRGKLRNLIHKEELMKNLDRAFSFPFKDPAWPTKFLLAALFMLLSLFLVGIFILAGYFVQVIQRVMRNEENAMPEWTDIGVMLVVGFKFCVACAVYLLPVLILYIPFLSLLIVEQFLKVGEELEMVTSLYFIIVVFFLVIPYSLVLALVSPVIAFRFAARERISDALDVGEVFRVFRRNWQNTAIVAVVGVGLSFVASFGILFFLVGICATTFYAYLVMSYMSGLLYLEQQKENLAT